MPNCFTLARKSDPTTPIPFATIDEELCEYLNEPCDPDKYFANWYDTIGLCLAQGITFAEMREKVGFSDSSCKIIDWFDENFTSDAWYSSLR